MRRFVLVEGRLAWDPERRRGGRGAYLHSDAKCVAGFTSRKPFLRSLRASVASAERARLIAERPASVREFSMAKKTVSDLLKELPGTERKDIFAYLEKQGKGKVSTKTPISDDEIEHAKEHYGQGPRRR